MTYYGKVLDGLGSKKGPIKAAAKAAWLGKLDSVFGAGPWKKRKSLPASNFCTWRLLPRSPIQPSEAPSPGAAEPPDLLHAAQPNLS